MVKNILIIDGPLMEFYRAKLEDGTIEDYAALKHKLYRYIKSIDKTVAIQQTNSVDKIIEWICEEVKKEYYDTIIVNTWLDQTAFNRVTNAVNIVSYMAQKKSIRFAIIGSKMIQHNGSQYVQIDSSMFPKYVDAIEAILNEYDNSTEGKKKFLQVLEDKFDHRIVTSERYNGIMH